MNVLDYVNIYILIGVLLAMYILVLQIVKPKRKIFFGYTSPASLKSDETFNAATRFSNLRFFVTAILFFAYGILKLSKVMGWSGTEIIFILLPFILIRLETEKFLKANFDDDGKRI